MCSVSWIYPKSHRSQVGASLGSTTLLCHLRKLWPVMNWLSLPHCSLLQVNILYDLALSICGNQFLVCLHSSGYRSWRNSHSHNLSVPISIDLLAISLETSGRSWTKGPSLFEAETASSSALSLPGTPLWAFTHRM